MISQLVRNFVNKKFMTSCYCEKKQGLSAIQKELLEKHGMKVSVGFLSNRLDEFGIKRRSSSESRRIVSDSPDWNKCFLTEHIIEWIDGFLIGDGSAGVNHDKQISRLSCGVLYKEFCEYMMSGLTDYKISEPKYYYSTTLISSVAFGSNAKGTFSSRTRFHPDLYQIASRWYQKGTPTKQVPDDVRISATSVMLWYLGDGTVINKDNTCVVRLSTDSFPREQIEDILIPKLKDHDIDCIRTSENRIRVTAKGLPGFFNLIGRTSPIKCYQYKFNLPEWRFTAKRMRDVASELGVSYNRLSYLVKLGLVGCYRASEKGRPRMLPEHIESAKKLKKEGVLY